MAGQYDNTNTGALFKVKEKKSEKHPDYNGSININGEEFWMSGWIRESKNSGEKFISLAFNPKNEQQGQRSSSSESSQVTEDEYADVPF